MQTFLPYEDFEESAYALDPKRLGKQRVETLQIMKALRTGKGWAHHPVVKMWRGYEFYLLTYQKAVCDAWVHDLGFQDTCFEKTAKLYFDGFTLLDDGPRPPWLGDRWLHLTHRSNLLRKDPVYYGKYFPGVPRDLPYYYPNSD